MTDVNLNALRVFSVVAAHGNLQRAADELNLSRGAVSQRIKQLEIDLGVVLLFRGARGCHRAKLHGGDGFQRKEAGTDLD